MTDLNNNKIFSGVSFGRVLVHQGAMTEMELVTVQALDFSAVNAASAVRGADDV